MNEGCGPYPLYGPKNEQSCKNGTLYLSEEPHNNLSLPSGLAQGCGRRVRAPGGAG